MNTWRGAIIQQHQDYQELYPLSTIMASPRDLGYTILTQAVPESLVQPAAQALTKSKVLGQGFLRKDVQFMELETPSACGDIKTHVMSVS